MSIEPIAASRQPSLPSDGMLALLVFVLAIVLLALHFFG
jgi:hypothetical protein